MTGLESRTYGLGSHRSINWATNTAKISSLICEYFGLFTRMQFGTKMFKGLVVFIIGGNFIVWLISRLPAFDLIKQENMLFEYSETT